MYNCIAANFYTFLFKNFRRKIVILFNRKIFAIELYTDFCSKHAVTNMIKVYNCENVSKYMKKKIKIKGMLVPK